MKKKLTKHGNSLALILDKPILELLNIDGTTELKISTDGLSINITPAHILELSADQKKIRESMKDIGEEYAPALKKLSNN